jgi:hypothetical protein
LSFRITRFLKFQVEIRDKKHFVSIGLLIGMQSALSNRKNHLAGFSVGQLFWTFIVDTEYGFITYNYYISDISDDS